MAAKRAIRVRAACDVSFNPSPMYSPSKVFAVRRILPCKARQTETPPSINPTSPPQAPGFTSSARIPNADTDSRIDRVREYGILALAVTAPIAGSIPVVGSPLRGVVEALLEILTVAELVHQNKKDIQNLQEKLVDLQHHISVIPYANDPVIRGLRDTLTSQLNGTLTRLESLQTRSRLRYLSVKHTIKLCSKDIEYYLQRFSALTVMYMAISMEQQQMIRSASISRRPIFTGVVLIDAIGKRYEIPIELAGSYEIFADAIRLLFKNDTLEARLQREYMQDGMYDLAIDGRDKIIAINGEQDWSEVQPGTTITMRVILLQSQLTNVRKYQCPRCRKWNYGSSSPSSIDCLGCDGRFQISNASVEQIAKYSRKSTPDQERMLLRNFHLKKYEIQMDWRAWVREELQEWFEEEEEDFNGSWIGCVIPEHRRKH